MNIPVTSFDPANACLADFTQGWKRHTDHPGIVLIEPGYNEIFLTAANDASCQAAILAVAEEQKHTDREAFRQAALYAKASSAKYMGISYSAEKGIIKGQDCLKPALQQIVQLSAQHAQMAGTGNNRTLTSIIENFGANSTGKHPKHSRPVSNRVFFAGGTLLKTNTGWDAAPEGDFLYIKEGFEHEPNLKKTAHANFDKLLVVSRSLYTSSYD